MSKDEIIEDLISKGIVIEIAGSFMVTEKYKQLLLPSSTPLVLPAPIQKIDDYDSLLNQKTNGGDWPIEILESTGRERAAALMNACEVPNTPPCGSYRLRGLNNEAVNVIGNIISSKTVEGATFIAATILYYKNMEKPKGFKNYILEGDALDVYNDHVTGDLEKSFKKSTDGEAQQWK